MVVCYDPTELAQQRLLRIVWKNKHQKNKQKTAGIESILTYWFCAWFCICTVAQVEILQRVIKTAQRTTKFSVLILEEL